jgi:hypothetical protein
MFSLQYTWRDSNPDLLFLWRRRWPLRHAARAESIFVWTAFSNSEKFTWKNVAYSWNWSGNRVFAEVWVTWSVSINCRKWPYIMLKKPLFRGSMLWSEFLIIFGEKLTFMIKNKCYDPNLTKTSTRYIFWAKSHFFRKYFRRKYFNNQAPTLPDVV